jgi:acid phosphatase (class A)
MEDWYNNITYGNLTEGQLEVLKKECLADEVMPILEQKFSDRLQFPLNNSATTRQELNDIASKIKTISNQENVEHFARYKRYDRSLLQSIMSVFQTKGLDVEEIVMGVNQDIAPTIMKLKQKYQRPRPYQLAQQYKLKLFPFDTLSGHSPSYPSGHTVQAFCILNIIANKHPESYDFCKKFIDDIANSRVYLGIHYPSDNDASYLIGGEILKLKSITDKYQI